MNTVLRRFGTALLLAITLGACAYQSQVIRLHPAPPDVKAASPLNAEGREVFLVTRDARSSGEIGRRSGGSNNETAMTTDSDIPALLQTLMTEVLKANGYRVLSAASANAPTLEIQLKELSYRAADVAGERKIKVQAAFEASVKNGTRTFRNTFRAEQERRVFFEPIAKSNEEWINETFGEGFKAMATDAQLLAALEP